MTAARTSTKAKKSAKRRPRTRKIVPEIPRAAIVAEARAWIGTPYRHQASIKGIACDCLGLMRGVWRVIYGTEPERTPAYSPDWAEGTGEETLIAAATRHMGLVAMDMPPDDILAKAGIGDLLVFRWRPNLPAKHVAILVSENRIVHAYDAAGKVAEGTLAPQWRRRVVAAFSFPPLPVKA